MVLILVECCSGANRCFSLRCEPSSWADSFERFRFYVRLLSSACVKVTGWSSSTGLYVSSQAKTVMSLYSATELYIYVYIWLRNRKMWAMKGWSSDRRIIRVLDMVLVLAIYSFLIYHAEIVVRNVIFSFPPDNWNGKWFIHLFTIPLSSSYVLQQTWGVNGLSWSPSLTPK